VPRIAAAAHGVCMMRPLGGFFDCIQTRPFWSCEVAGLSAALAVIRIIVLGASCSCVPSA